jgi:hypothetical protein
MGKANPHSFEFVPSKGFESDLKSSALSKRIPRAAYRVAQRLREADAFYTSHAKGGSPKWSDVVESAEPPPDDLGKGWLLFSLWKDAGKSNGRPDALWVVWVDTANRTIWHVHIRAVAETGWPVGVEKSKAVRFARHRFRAEMGNNDR